MNCMATGKLSCGPRAVLEAKWHPTTDVLTTGRQEEWERRAENDGTNGAPGVTLWAPAQHAEKHMSMAFHASHQADLPDWTKK